MQPLNVDPRYQEMEHQDLEEFLGRQLQNSPLGQVLQVLLWRRYLAQCEVYDRAQTMDEVSTVQGARKELAYLLNLPAELAAKKEFEEATARLDKIDS